MRKNTNFKITMAAVSSALNIVGANIALLLRFPLYLDAVGTVFSASLLGPGYGIATGIIATCINQITDPFAIWFMPSNIITAVLTGLIFKNCRKEYRFTPKLFIFALLISLPGTLISSITAAYLFDGVTSSGSSILVQIMHNMGMGLVASVLLTQVITDYLDRLLALTLTLLIIKTLPQNIVEKVRISNGSI